MPVTLLRVGRTLASALLCVLPCLALAAPLAPFVLIGDSPRTLSPAGLAAAQKAETPGRPSSDGKTLAFRQKFVRLVAVTGPGDDMFSYRIGGLRNPTLIVCRGATLKLLFVNTDDDMRHDIQFCPAPKAHPNGMPSWMKSSVGAPEVPPRTTGTLHGEELRLRAPAAPGSYVYFCAVRGHAQGGMVGKLIVR